jgi:hypothetical protein
MKQYSPQGNAADDRRVRADRRAPADYGRAILMLAFYKGPRVDDIGKNAGRPAKNLVFQYHIVVNGNVILDFHSVADCRPAPNVDVLPQGAVGSDLGPGHYMGKMPYFGSGTDNGPLVDIGRRVTFPCSPAESGNFDNFVIPHRFYLFLENASILSHTSSTSSSLSSGKIGRARMRLETDSATGKSPSLYPKQEKHACR